MIDVKIAISKLNHCSMKLNTPQGGVGNLYLFLVTQRNTDNKFEISYVLNLSILTFRQW